VTNSAAKGAALDRWLFAPAPAERLATVRLLSGAYCFIYLLVRMKPMADFRAFHAERFNPVGLAQLLPGPLPHAALLALYVATLVACAAFTLGYRFKVSGPALGLLLFALTSYRHSWGMLFHTDNLVLVHSWVLALTPSAAALSLDARKSRLAPQADARFGWPLRLLCALTAASYLLAGIAKLKISGMHWMEGEILRNYIAYDALRKLRVGSLYSPFGAWLVQHSWPFMPIGMLTMVLELGAPLALVHTRLGQLWVLGIWGFHVGVLATMAIGFGYPLSGVAYASFFACERLWTSTWLRRVHAALSPPALRSPTPV
jgi:Vitamin K-dependent gamma-carboxylase